jgi:hypothetical protein
MDYETQLKCKRPQCEGVLTIPIKIVVRRDLAVILTRCYRCRTKYKVMLSTLNRDQWLPVIRDLFNRCENCGIIIPHEWTIYGAGFSLGSSSQLLHRNLRLANPCPNCGGNGPKAVDDWLWSFLKPQETPLPKFTVPPPTSKLFCGNCGSSIVPGASFCTSCGAKV